MVVTPDHWHAVTAALGLDPTKTLSLNISPHFIYIVHADQAVTAQPIAPADVEDPEED